MKLPSVSEDRVQRRIELRVCAHVNVSSLNKKHTSLASEMAQWVKVLTTTPDTSVQPPKPMFLFVLISLVFFLFAALDQTSLELRDPPVCLLGAGLKVL